MANPDLRSRIVRLDRLWDPAHHYRLRQPIRLGHVCHDGWDSGVSWNFVLMGWVKRGEMQGQYIGMLCTFQPYLINSDKFPCKHQNISIIIFDNYQLFSE